MSYHVKPGAPRDTMPGVTFKGGSAPGPSPELERQRREAREEAERKRKEEERRKREEKAAKARGQRGFRALLGGGAPESGSRFLKKKG